MRLFNIYAKKKKKKNSRKNNYICVDLKHILDYAYLYRNFRMLRNTDEEKYTWTEWFVWKAQPTIWKFRRRTPIPDGILGQLQAHT